MPPLLAALPAIAAIAGIGAAGTTIGLDIANSGGGTPAPTATTSAAPTPAQLASTLAAQKAAVAQQLPTEEGLTSGFANPGYYAQQGGLAAGVAGQPGGAGASLQAVEQALGLPPGSLSGLGNLTGGGATAAIAKPFKPVGSGQTNAGAFPNDPTALSDFVRSFIST